MEISTIAKWLGIPDNYVNIGNGHGAFEDFKQQEQGKYRYDDAEVKANFDFRTAIDKRTEQKIKFGRDLNEKDEIRYKVLNEGYTINQLKKDNPLAYQNDYSTLDKFRLKYISEHQTPPKIRLNLYICGRGGAGKGLLSRAIARELGERLGFTDDRDIFFEVGAKGVPFEGYDGQPIIIWNDRRAEDLLEELNGRGNLFNVFDTFPTKTRQNVKYASVNLCNQYNIVNSVQSYEEFLRVLTDEYIGKNGKKHLAEDKRQGLRRFPLIFLYLI